MDRESALERLHEITRGIDRDDYESDDGWWETSTGARRGRKVLDELTALVLDLT